MRQVGKSSHTLELGPVALLALTLADGCAEGPRDGLGFCTALCTTGQPCPADESGLGVPQCILELFDAPAVCALTCRGGVCPPDLECTEFGGFLICM